MPGALQISGLVPGAFVIPWEMRGRMFRALLIPVTISSLQHLHEQQWREVQSMSASGEIVPLWLLSATVGVNRRRTVTAKGIGPG